MRTPSIASSQSSEKFPCHRSKCDNLLLKFIIATRDSTITVLDVSSHANQDPLLQLLKQGKNVHYFDHHFAGEMPESPLFHPHIDTSPDVCSSMLVDRFLSGKYRLWAIVASFGDNLHVSVHELASSLKLDPKKLKNYENWES